MRREEYASLSPYRTEGRVHVVEAYPALCWFILKWGNVSFGLARDMSFKSLLLRAVQLRV